MSHLHPMHHEHHPDAHQDVYSKTIFGFWIYILTDFMMFAAFFATYLVLHDNTFGGPSAKELFNLPFNFLQTILLLLATFTAGIGGALAHRRSKQGVIAFFLFTLVLGGLFLFMEGVEFKSLMDSGNSWDRSAFLSSYFTLVGMHGAHTCFALLWIIVLLIPVMKEGVSDVSVKRLTCLKMFWQFLNIVWIFIFSIVYLIGAY